MEGLAEVEGPLRRGTPISWLREVLAEELWEEEQFQGGNVPIPPGLQTVWDQLSRFLGQHTRVTGDTIRDWRRSLMLHNTHCDKCQCRLGATCSRCGQSRCSVWDCTASHEACSTCRTAPTRMERSPHRQPTLGKRKHMVTTFNLNSVGRHFIESIKDFEDTQTDAPTGRAISSGEERPLTDLRFKASIRGWSHKTHITRAEALLALQDQPMTAALRNNKDILLIPRAWWLNKTESLDPEDPGWWYTVTKAIRFRECRTCERRRGDDLDKETKAYLNRTCEGCKKSF